MNLETLKVKLSLIALFYFLTVDYKYFGIFFIIFFIIFGINFTTNIIEENLFRLLPILFYLKKYILGFSDRYSELWTKTSLNDFYLQSKFPDINIDILQYKCQHFLYHEIRLYIYTMKVILKLKKGNKMLFSFINVFVSCKITNLLL